MLNRKRWIVVYALVCCHLLVWTTGCRDVKGLIELPQQERIKAIRKENRALLNQGQYQQVVNNMELALDKYPNANALWYTLGQAHVHLKHYQAAIDAFDQVTRDPKLNSYFWSAYEQRGWAYFHLGNYTQAIRHFDTNISRKVETAKIVGKPSLSANPFREGKGRALMCMHQYDQAVQVFEEGLAVDPQDVQLHYYKAQALAAQNDSIGAAKADLSQDERGDSLQINTSPTLPVVEPHATVAPPVEPQPSVESQRPAAIVPMPQSVVPFTGPTLELDAVLVEPDPVVPGEAFEVIVDLRVSDPQVELEEVTLTMDYCITQAGKVLKRFKTKEFAVSNQDFDAVIRRPKAAQTPGTYTVEVELRYQDIKATGQADFTIQ